MKKVITVLFAVPCILVASHTAVKAQGNAYVASASYSTVPNSDKVENLNAPYGVSEKIFSDFTKRFDNASDVIWSTRGNHTFAYLKENGVPVRVVYNKKGKLTYSIKYYTGSQVPEKFKNVATENGYNMNVFQVTEVKHRFSTTSFVKMEDKTSYLTLQVLSNGEVSVSESYLKSK